MREITKIVQSFLATIGDFATMNPLSFCAFGALKSFRYCPVFLSVFLCLLPDLTIRKNDSKSKDGMGLSCVRLREGVAL